MLQNVSELPPSLKLNNIPLYVHTAFCLSIPLLIDILVTFIKSCIQVTGKLTLRPLAYSPLSR